jgi:hypothetical protein
MVMVVMAIGPAGAGDGGRSRRRKKAIVVETDQ